MEIDSLFKQGHDHKICEDYCVHGSTPFPYLILSDGSSGSSNTDVGSRILCHVTESILKECPLEILESMNSNELGKVIITKSQTLSSALSLNDNILDATLIIVWHNANKNKLSCRVYGDGNIFYSQKGKLFSYNFNYDANYPFYLSYKLNPEREAFLKENIEQKFNMKLQINKKSIKNSNPMEFYPKINISTTNLDWLCIASDGIETFDNTQHETVIQQLSQFKKFKGVFVERRLNKVIKNFSKENIHHSDDIAIAGIYFDRNKEEE